jgi:Patatin-like phospholipase
MTRTGQKTAFVFAGGGSLGAIQVGMLGVLVSEGVQPDFVVGASVGAMNAVYFAGAPDAEGVTRLAEIWSRLQRSEIFPVTFKSAFGLLRHPESIIDSSGLRHLIETNLAYARLEEATVPVHVTANGRRNRQQLSYSGGGGPRSVADRRASNWICLLLERASERSDRQGLARNHPFDRVAAHPRCRAAPRRDRCVRRAGALSARRVAIRFLGVALSHSACRG